MLAHHYCTLTLTNPSLDHGVDVLYLWLVINISHVVDPEFAHTTTKTACTTFGNGLRGGRTSEPPWLMPVTN